MKWITDWTEIDGNARYISCAIAFSDSSGYYLYDPCIRRGWEVKRLRELCYAALPMPEFKMPEFKMPDTPV